MSQILRRIAYAAALPLAATLLLAAPMSASASISYGTLSNFDVFNDTGEVTHGFEIELDGISSSDITYKFGAPYERYGNPTVTDFPGGVFVHYESPYDPATHTFTQGTPMAPNPVTPTQGHACWTGGSANYASAGCEHFGLGLSRNPTNTVYRWLVADPAHPGALTPAGTNVSIPAPVWSVSPPPAGAPNPAPIVKAVIPPPAPQVYEFGPAQWVKVYVTESPEPAQLNHLLSDDPKVPNSPAETETEWVLMQEDSANPGVNDLTEEAQMQPGDKSVTRRYEFYKYTGAYDPESHEALPADPNTPAPSDIGDYIGAQMAAANVGAAPPADPLVATAAALPAAEQDVFYSAPLVTGGTPPMTATLTKKAFPLGLMADTDGNLAGTPTAAGKFSFTVKVKDDGGQAVTAAHTLTVARPLGLLTKSLPKAQWGKPYKAQLKGRYGVAPYSWSLVAGTLPDGLTLDPASGLISGTPVAGAPGDMLTVELGDAAGAAVQGTFPLLTGR